MLFAFTLFVLCVNFVTFFMSRYDLWNCTSDSDVDESTERWWRILRYVIVMNFLVNLLFFWVFYTS